MINKMATMTKYFPKVRSDICAMGFMLGTIHCICLFELFIILPYIDSDPEHHETRMPTFWFHFVLGLYLYSTIMVSFSKIIRTESSSGSVILPSILKPGWRFCVTCESNCPPRAFHCWTCNKCILKRDHHCMFTGNCIGYKNMRYFITMVFYLCISAAYCTYLNMDYTFEVIGGLTPISIFTMIMPLFSWILGFSESYTFGVAFVSSTCLIGFCLLGAFLFYHLSGIFNGQTCYERSHNIRDHDYGWKGNLRDVFGNNWPISWLSPYISSPMPGNGIEFPNKFMYENVKDM